MALSHLLVSLAAALAFSGALDAREITPRATPEFTHVNPEQWINSPPLSIEALRGSVVLIDFWTFDCWNCYRSFPWLNVVEEKYGPRGLKVIGVHTPEFRHERMRSDVERKVTEFKLRHPVMIDNDFSYWNAMGNRYWPAFYVLDREGRLRGQFVGETHAGDARALAVEALLENLLAEQPR